MCKLVIEQEFNKVELEFRSPVDAGIMVDSLQPYVSKKTTFTITLVEAENTMEGEVLEDDI